MTRSIPLGVLRLAAMTLPADRVLHRSGAMEIERLMYERLADDAYAVKRLMPSQVVFASGTARLIAKLTSASRLRSGVWRVSRAAVTELVADLENQTPAKLVARGIPSDRADTIAVGAVAFGTVNWPRFNGHLGRG
jgi:exopolyphosphatase/pppGpp-phosphohydrolase